MNVDRNVLQIVHRYIHESFTRDLLVEYHSRVKPELHACDQCDHNVCDYYIYFDRFEYNHRYLGCSDMQKAIFNLYGKKIVYNGEILKVPINY